MLYFVYGSDRQKARAALDKQLKKEAVLRITDAHSIGDLSMALQGPGMFDEKRAVVFDGILGGENEEMGRVFIDSLKHMRDSQETFFVLEGALDAATRKQVEKYAEKSEKFDSPKKEKDDSIFALANALQKGDRKALWVGLMQQFAKKASPQAVHGLLFWGAKKMLLSARDAAGRKRALSLVTELAKLPHEARRHGVELEYALERFVLSMT